MIIDTIARRYANALADIIIESDEEAAVKAELKTWEELLKADTEMRTLVNPTIDHKLKQNVLEELISRTRPTPTTANFLRVLIKNKRLRVLPEINSELERVLDQRGGSVQANVTSARELSDGERSELIQNLVKLTGRRVKPRYHVDSELIGGVVTQIGSTVYDGSVRKTLENLREELVNG
jgi:F-type H+-transporting ATPase subunit delta